MMQKHTALSFKNTETYSNHSKTKFMDCWPAYINLITAVFMFPSHLRHHHLLLQNQCENQEMETTCCLRISQKEQKGFQMHCMLEKGVNSCKLLRKES